MPIIFADITMPGKQYYSLDNGKLCSPPLLFIDTPNQMLDLDVARV